MVKEDIIEECEEIDFTMNFVVTMQIRELVHHEGFHGEANVLTTTYERAWLFDDFKKAKKKFREMITSMAKNYRYFPFEKNQYLPLLKYCQVRKLGPKDEDMIILKMINKFLKNPDYDDYLPEKMAYSFEEDELYIDDNNDLYFKIYNKILHFNAMDMYNDLKAYFFNYQEVVNNMTTRDVRFYLKLIDKKLEGIK